MQENSRKIIKGATSLGIGAFLAKLLGAIYRIPLTNMLGGTGLGLYQMVFPVYCVLLDFSGAGVPQALSKLIASVPRPKRLSAARKYLFTALKLLCVLGILGTALMFVFSKRLSIIQGNADARFAYLALAPAVFLVSLISCFRGYFQGLMNMTPTAVSQVLEQVIKLLLGLAFVKLFLPSVPKAVGGATLAISISEVVALLYLYFNYRTHRRKNILQVELYQGNFKILSKNIVKVTIPITLIGIIIPMSQVIDSFLIINILSAYTEKATSLYGLLSGVAATVINLPVSVCYGVATVAVPAVSQSKSEEEQQKNAFKTLGLTLVIAIPCAFFLGVASPLTVKILFSGLSETEKPIAINLIRLCSPCVILLSLLQTSNAVLIGKGKLYLPVFSLMFGVVAKTVLSIVLLKNPQLNVYGGAIALIACYFIVCLINLLLIFNLKVKHANKRTCNRQYAS